MPHGNEDSVVEQKRRHGMAEWKPLKQDFSIWKKFDFKFPAVAIKYLYYKPEGVKQ